MIGGSALVRQYRLDEKVPKMRVLGHLFAPGRGSNTLERGGEERKPGSGLLPGWERNQKNERFLTNGLGRVPAQDLAHLIFSL